MMQVTLPPYVALNQFPWVMQQTGLRCVSAADVARERGVAPDLEDSYTFWLDDPKERYIEALTRIELVTLAAMNPLDPTPVEVLHSILTMCSTFRSLISLADET